MTQLPDGSVLQDGLKFNKKASNPGFVAFPVIGIIRNVYHLDDESNKYGNTILCDVYIPQFSTELFNVPFMYPLSSSDNFIDYRPEGVNKVVAPKTESPTPLNPLKLDPTKVDGDMCVIQFLNGNQQQPFIIGMFPSYHSTKKGGSPYPRHGKSKGSHYRIRINGMELEFTKDGNIEIKSTKTRAKTKDVKPNKKISINLSVEKDDPDVPTDQKQSIKIEIDNTEDAPKVSTIVTDNTSEQKKQSVVFDGTSRSITVTNEHDNGENTITLSSAGMVINIKGDTPLTIDGDLTASITGKTELTIDGDAKIDAAGKVDIISGSTATVKASTKAIVDCSAIELGDGATEAIIKGNIFQGLFNAHLHPTTTGPSGPPTVPLAGTELSLVSKTK